jgi:hypothetical protein
MARRAAEKGCCTQRLLVMDLRRIVSAQGGVFHTLSLLIDNDRNKTWVMAAPVTWSVAIFLHVQNVMCKPCFALDVSADYFVIRQIALCREAHEQSL